MCVRFPAFALLDHAVSNLKVPKRQEVVNERGQMPQILIIRVVATRLSSVPTGQKEPSPTSGHQPLGS